MLGIQIHNLNLPAAKMTARKAAVNPIILFMLCLSKGLVAWYGNDHRDNCINT